MPNRFWQASTIWADAGKMPVRQGGNRTASQSILGAWGIQQEGPLSANCGFPGVGVIT